MKRGIATGLAVHDNGERIALGFQMDGEQYTVELSLWGCLTLIAGLASAVQHHHPRAKRRPQ